MDLVLDLPQVLSSDVLLKWLKPKDLCGYDCALCNCIQRPKLRAMYDTLQDASGFVTTVLKTSEASISLIKWAGARNIKLREFTLQGSTYLNKYYETLQTFLKQSGHHLHSLVITNFRCPMSAAIALVVKTCPNLHTLEVSNCALPYSIPQMLMCKNNHIRDLYLETPWHQKSMISKSYFANVTSLTVERFRLAGMLEVGCLQEVGRAFPNLQEIHLKVEFTTRDSWRDRSDGILLWDGTQCWLDFLAVCNPRIRTFGLCEAFWVNSLSLGTFSLMLNTWKHLTSLEVLHCERLRGFGLYIISIYCANTLECFTFRGNYEPDEHLVPALVQFKALRSLHIYCSIVDDIALRELLIKLPTLRELDLRHTYRDRFCLLLSVVTKYGSHLESYNYSPMYTGYEGETPCAGLVAKLVRKCLNLRVLRIMHDHDAAKQARPELQVEMCARLPIWCQLCCDSY